MNFGLKGWVTSLTLVVGGFPAFSAMMVTGSGTPADDFRPVNAARVQQFINSHPSRLRLDDSIQFSAEVERNDRALSDAPVAPVVNIPQQTPPRTHMRPQIASSVQPAASITSLCANGYNAIKIDNSGTLFDCVKKDTFSGDAGSFITDMVTYYEVHADGSKFVNNGEDADGNGEFGTQTPIPYGVEYQSVDYRQPQVGQDGATFTEGEYDNYFVGSKQEAQSVMDFECSRGIPVTYNNTVPGHPEAGWQVQVCAFSPGTQDVSPLPPGDTNLCPPQPPPTNNN